VAISEIMYHPVERPAFDGDGAPLLDLSREVHEFVELHNPGTEMVKLAGWKLGGGIGYNFPQWRGHRGGPIPGRGRNPDRLAAVAAYGLKRTDLFGPFSGQLGNRRDTVRLMTTPAARSML